MDKEFVTWLEDIFAIVPDTTVKKMFGGVGMFRHGLMYALAMSDGRVALKADSDTTPAFQAENCDEWSYQRKDGKVTKMGYWYLPERLLEDPDELLEWSLAAFDVAVRADQKKSPSQRKHKPLI